MLYDVYTTLSYCRYRSPADCSLINKTMANNERNTYEKIISKFVFTTCQVLPRPNMPSFFAMIIKSGIGSIKLGGPGLAQRELHSTGSAAEFYISPVLPCIGDVDIMNYRKCEVAKPEAVADVKEGVHKICRDDTLPVQNPGYVRVFCTWSNINGDDGNLAPNLAPDHLEPHPENVGIVAKHGPAMKGPIMMEMTEFRHRPWVISNECDLVSAMRCSPMWLDVVREWPSRRREFGWPDEATIAKVVQQGIDIVPVSHRDCKDSEQWRYSFSRAEVTLINSWTPSQQIVYHMLRYLAHNDDELYSVYKDGSIISNYNIKTLMLWECENHSPEYRDFRNSSNKGLIGICCDILKLMDICLRDRQCRNYFMPQSNLMDHSMDSETVQKVLKRLKYFSIDENLSRWFVEKYIRKAMEDSDMFSPAVLDEMMSDIEKLSDGIERYFEWNEKFLKELKRNELTMECMSSLIDQRTRDPVDALVHLLALEDLPKVDKHLLDYNNAVVLLYMATDFKYGPDLSIEIRKHYSLILALFGSGTETECLANMWDKDAEDDVEHCSVTLQRAIMLMGYIDKQSATADRLILAELTRECLHEALEFAQKSSSCVSGAVVLSATEYLANNFKLSSSDTNSAMEQTDEIHNPPKRLVLETRKRLVDVLTKSAIERLNRFHSSLGECGFFTHAWYTH